MAEIRFEASQKMVSNAPPQQNVFTRQEDRQSTKGRRSVYQRKKRILPEPEKGRQSTKGKQTVYQRKKGSLPEEEEQSTRG